MGLEVDLSVVGVWDWVWMFCHVLRGCEGGGGGGGFGMSHCVASVAVAPTKVARRKDLRRGWDIDGMVDWVGGYRERVGFVCLCVCLHMLIGGICGNYTATYRDEDVVQSCSSMFLHGRRLYSRPGSS